MRSYLLQRMRASYKQLPALIRPRLLERKPRAHPHGPLPRRMRDRDYPRRPALAEPDSPIRCRARLVLERSGKYVSRTVVELSKERGERDARALVADDLEDARVEVGEGIWGHGGWVGGVNVGRLAGSWGSVFAEKCMRVQRGLRRRARLQDRGGDGRISTTIMSIPSTQLPRGRSDGRPRPPHEGTQWW